MEQIQEEAERIVENHGIEYKTLIEKALMVKDEERLIGSIYLNQEITEFYKFYKL